MADSDEDRKRGAQDEDNKDEKGKKDDKEDEGDQDPPGDDESLRYNLISALNHKIRRQMLRRLNRSKGPLSPAKLSKQLELPVSNLSYHMDVLRKCSAVAIVSEQQVRGAIEHLYESRVSDHPVSRPCSRKQKQGTRVRPAAERRRPVRRQGSRL